MNVSPRIRPTSPAATGIAEPALGNVPHGILETVGVGIAGREAEGLGSPYSVLFPISSGREVTDEQRQASFVILTEVPPQGNMKQRKKRERERVNPNRKSKTQKTQKSRDNKYFEIPFFH